MKPGERVLVVGSGCGVYPCVLAKNTRAEEIVGIELNPLGHQYALENVRLNRLKNVRFLEGDVHDVLPDLRESFDRIVMPLPTVALDLLLLVLPVAKSGAVIHVYAFEKEAAPSGVREQVRKLCKKARVNYSIQRLVKCGQVAQRTFRVCADTKIV